MVPWFNIGNLVALLFLIGATIMSFFLILSGGRSSGVLKNFYWIEADTSGFNNAANLTRWFNYEFCGYAQGRSFDCSSRAPAKPFSPKDNFGASPLMPRSFIDNRDTYYYLSRVGWAMLLIAVFFEVCTLVPQIIGVFKHIRPLSIFATVTHWLSLFFLLLAACLLTGCHAKGIRAFHGRDRHAKMGAKCFALLWTSVFLLLCTSIWSVVATALKKKEERNSTRYYTTGAAVAGTGAGAGMGGGRVRDDEEYGGYTDTNTGKSTEVTDDNYNDNLETSQLPRNPNAVVTGDTAANTNYNTSRNVATATPPPSSDNTNKTKNKLFNKIKTQTHKKTGDDGTLLTTTKEEEEYEVMP